VSYRADCFILREVNVKFYPLGVMFEIIRNYIATQDEGVVWWCLWWWWKFVFLGSAAWKYLVYLTSNDITAKFVLPLVGTLDCWNASCCYIVKQRNSISASFFTDHIFPCLFFAIYVKWFLLIPKQRQLKLLPVASCRYHGLTSAFTFLKLRWKWMFQSINTSYSLIKNNATCFG